MKTHYDIAVIGAGPAGMRAAVLAAEHGADVALLDEQPGAGGQIYRGITRQRASDRAVLGPDYYQGASLAEHLATSAVDHIPQASVWQVSQDLEIGVTAAGKARLISADQVIIATGALERPFPLPGWTLPGVMTAGAAQILLKSSGVTLPEPVFVGTGPLLYLIAHQYLRAGVKIAGILDTTPPENFRKALPLLPAAARDLGQIWKGWSWLRDLRRAGLPFVRGVQDLRITGDAAAGGVAYKVDGAWHTMAAQTVLLHQGVVPNVNLAMATGCAHEWSEAQLCWHARCDDWGMTSVNGVSIAGDGARIVGASGAEDAGALAALGALYRLGKLDQGTRDHHAAPLLRGRARQRPFRQFLDQLYRPALPFRVPLDDATLVCRCEEVSAGAVRAAVQLGCQGPNQLKSFTRAGMGPCQGRMCGLTISAVMADARDCSVAEVGAARLRAPVKPLELGQLAALSDPE